MGFKEELNSYKKRFLEYLEHIRGYTPQTIKSYETSLNKILRDSEIEEEKERVIINIMRYRLNSIKKSKRTIYANLSRIRSFVKYLNDIEEINVTLKGAQNIKLPHTLPKPLDKRDILKVIENEDEKIKLIIKVFYGLGVRISEICEIKLEDFMGNFIRIRGKGNKSRDVPILDSLNKEIKRYIELYNPKEYLFEKNNKPYKDSQIRYLINKTFAKYGIKATPHQLRHSFASHLLNSGARIADVSELLGHSSMATTQIYTKLSHSIKLQNYLKAHPLAKED
ncbi:MAG: tyrosine-type recombinase/integrase [Epsilonproteobacteria bacterium]|nr:tyrosine-type recombinase/integrase [Campylobacterota bacterium]